MDLLLWRHAEAVDGSPDHTRELTPRGLKQARRMARWLEDNRPKNLKVLVSPTLRTRQTATAFTDEFEIVSSLGPEGNVADILAATGWPEGNGAARRRRARTRGRSRYCWGRAGRLGRVGSWSAPERVRASYITNILISKD